MLTDPAMTPDRWQRLTDIVNDAMEQSAADRQAYLVAQCAGDSALVRQALTLIANATGATQFLEHTPALLDAEAETLIGRRLGAYRVITEIARGGMGAVLKAVRDDDVYKKEVAIKVIRTDVGSGKVVERFKNERQLLATLDHPHIARVIDGGTTDDGRPYFVMDFVDGEPIDAYCQHRSLNVVQRLMLFRTVCETVHFAHQRLIVHRDLKPSNILVDQAGNVKLLDFGIAKLLDTQSAPKDFELTVALAMTPAYASPEQVKGETITTASDIYALGVILYRLLTGRSPYQSEPTKPLDLAREIVETDPHRPSTVVFETHEGTPSSIEPARLKRALQGDLDNIVMMALRKDAARRYASAEQLGEDVRRYLDDEPVLAHQDSVFYRTGKFVRRNRWSSVLAIGGSIALAATAAVAMHQANDARRERDRAESHFNSVRAIANKLIFDVHDAVEAVPGSTKAREIIVREAVTYLDAIAAQNESRSELVAEVASGYERLAQVQGGWRSASMAKREESIASLRKALALRERLAQMHPTDKLALRSLILTLGKLGESAGGMGNAEEATTHQERVLAVSEQAMALPNPELTDELNVVRARFVQASHQMRFGKKENALPQILTAMQDFDALAKRDPRNTRLQRNAAAVMNQGAYWLLWNNGSIDEAERYFQRSLALLERSSASEPNSPSIRRIIAIVNGSYAELIAKRGALQHALDKQIDAHTTLTALADEDRENIAFRLDAWAMGLAMTDKLRKLNRNDQAISLLNQQQLEIAAQSKRAQTASQQPIRELQALTAFERARAYAQKRDAGGEKRATCNSAVGALIQASEHGSFGLTDSVGARATKPDVMTLVTTLRATCPENVESLNAIVAKWS